MGETLDLVDDNRFTLTLRSTSEAVRQTLSLITTHFAGLISETELATLELVLAETLNNVVEHATPEREQGQASLHIMPQQGGLACTVRDNGLPMPDGRLPPKRLPRVDTIIQDLPEGGFGWPLICMFVQELDYRREGGVNILYFLLPFTQKRDS